MKKEKVLVSRETLQTLIDWCNDAIDFHDETDELAADAFKKVVREADLDFHRMMF